MPTNKLWIEHTERAAWDSVAALRGELAEAKKRLEHSEARVRSMEEQLARARGPAPIAAPVAPPVDEADEFLAVARRFVRAMQHRHRALAQAGAPLDLQDALAALESKVSSLDEMDEVELSAAAVDVAVFALCLHREARRAAGR